MKISIIGTGIVGRTLATKLVSTGHDVMMGTRNVSQKLSSKEKESRSDVAFSEWLMTNSKIKLGTFSEAAAFGEIVFNATPGGKSVEILKSAGRENLAGRILIDLSNALKWGNGEASLLPGYSDTTSLGEEIQKAFPDTKVVKTFNTIWCGIMVNPEIVNGGNHTNFISGNDQGAKKEVIRLLREFGWKEKNIIDIGDITSSRAAEAYLLLWVKLLNLVGNQAFSIQLVK